MLFVVLVFLVLCFVCCVVLNRVFQSIFFSFIKKIKIKIKKNFLCFASTRKYSFKLINFSLKNLHVRIIILLHW